MTPHREKTRRHEPILDLVPNNAPKSHGDSLTFWVPFCFAWSILFSISSLPMFVPVFFQAFACLDRYFRLINGRRGSLQLFGAAGSGLPLAEPQLSRAASYTIVNTQFEGIDIMWEIALQSERSDVAQVMFFFIVQHISLWVITEGVFVGTPSVCVDDWFPCCTCVAELSIDLLSIDVLHCVLGAAALLWCVLLCCYGLELMTLCSVLYCVVRLCELQIFSRIIAKTQALFSLV